MPTQRASKFAVQPELYIENSATPVNAPFHLVPSAAPTNAAAGDFYFDSTALVKKTHSGVAWEYPGARRVVKQAAATLTEADSTALLMFNAAAGFTYTLPPAAVGLWFDVIVQTTVTSSVARLACATGDFFVGTILQGQPTTFTQTARTANGTTHLAWEGNGTTTGGIIGDVMQVVAISDTQWAIYGTNSATGSTATPFKTS
jgi:hypothetical protein